MTISTAQVQERLAKLIDPVAGIDYVSGKMLKGVETDDAGGVTVKIELGYPARFAAQSVKATVEAAGDARRKEHHCREFGQGRRGQVNSGG